ncbi:hypothetical protein OAU50_03480 [Planctomycetota bacterium]|nr:hypothetical protein [Planctomycetota bacterium]
MQISRVSLFLLLALFLSVPLVGQSLTVENWAGNGSGAGQRDGTGAAASFNRPRGIAVDSSGNIYVADTDNHTIRKLTPTGVVTTLAGLAGAAGSVDGTGVTARFSSPRGISIDSSGNVYVADTNNHTIRKISPTGVVSTLVGTAGSMGSADGTGAAARFNSPHCVAVDSSGNIYVADTDNHTIRIITPAGVVSTLAGSAGSIGSADGAGSAASFFFPRGVAVDSSGNLYVADTNNQTIRMITPTGVVSTIAGTVWAVGSTDGTGAAARFTSPSDISIDASSNLYVADAFNHTIRKITPTGVVSTLAGTAGAEGGADGIGAAASFRRPRSAAVDVSGNVYVADTFNHAIRRVDPTGTVSTLAGTTGAADSVDGIGVAARFSSPRGISIDSSGNVYVADTNNHTIRKISPTGAVSTLAGTAGVPGSADGTGAAARFYLPYDVAVDVSGNL